MRNKILLILSLIFISSNIALAQTARKTVTNADLDKYRLKRERAEADYRENYAKMGMPSPEELAKQREKDSRERAELSQRLAFERQQREQSDELRRRVDELNLRLNYINNSAAQSASFSNGSQFVTNGFPIVGGGFGGFGGGLFLGNGNFNNRGWNNRRNFPPRFVRGVPNAPAIVAGGGMVYSIPRPSTVAPGFGGRRF